MNNVVNYPANKTALVYCEKNFAKQDGKTANGLVRLSEKYRIVGVIDSDKTSLDAGEVLDGVKNGIPIFRTLSEAVSSLKAPPNCFIYGMAPLHGVLSENEGEVIFAAMDAGMDIINGLHEFLTDDARFVDKAKDCNVDLVDIRKPKAKKDLRLFTGEITEVHCPKIAILGTDSAIGKRTTATILTQALKDAGLNAILVATGQTGLIQGARYGVALDAIPEQFISGEMEGAMVNAYREGKPDVLIIEGQGALSHPAYLSSCFIIRGSRPDAIIMQHAPGRKTLGDYPKMPMPTLGSEIKLANVFSGAPIIGIAINHEDMSEGEVCDVIGYYEDKYQTVAADVLANGAAVFVAQIFESFPQLSGKGSTRVKKTAAP